MNGRRSIPRSNDPNWSLRTPRQSSYSGPHYVTFRRDRTGLAIGVAFAIIGILAGLLAYIAH